MHNEGDGSNNVYVMCTLNGNDREHDVFTVNMRGCLWVCCCEHMALQGHWKDNSIPHMGEKPWRKLHVGMGGGGEQFGNDFTFARKPRRSPRFYR